MKMVKKRTKDERKSREDGRKGVEYSDRSWRLSSRAGSLKEFMKAKSFSSAAWSRWKRRGFLNVAIFYEKTL